MENIKIEQYKDFKKNYEFDLMRELGALERVEKVTWNSKTMEIAKGSKDRILDRIRPKKDKESTILFEYSLYLTNFMKDKPKTFDVILEHMQENKHNYMGVEVLRQIASQL